MNKKTAIILICIALFATACKQSNSRERNQIATHESEIVSKNYEKSADYHNVDDKINRIIGQTFRNQRELERVSGWRYTGGSFIDANMSEFAVEHYIDENGNLIIALGKFVYGELERLGIRILDAINVGKLDENEFLQILMCRLNGVSDNEIIAIAVWESDKEFFDKIIRAWRADTEAGKIKEIDTEGVDCENAGFHA